MSSTESDSGLEARKQALLARARAHVEHLPVGDGRLCARIIRPGVAVPDAAYSGAERPSAPNLLPMAPRPSSTPTPPRMRVHPRNPKARDACTELVGGFPGPGPSAFAADAVLASAVHHS